MAHKGYTSTYFINFFSAIPANEWTQGRFRSDNGLEKPDTFCALGHCMRNFKTNEFVEDTAHPRVEALDKLLGDKAMAINDNSSGYRHLGKTPRARILKALRNVKRTGSVHGTKKKK